MAVDQIARMMALDAAQQGGGGDVDQTYDPTSENAQSGTAGAQALAAEKMTKIFSETFSYQWSTAGTNLDISFTQTITMKNNTLYLAVIYASDNSNEVMGSIFMTKGSSFLATILKGRTSIPYFDDPNIVTGLANLKIISGRNLTLTLRMPAISTTPGTNTGRLEVYEITFILAEVH